ncbi:MAG: hypothetical protein JOZ55_04800 [Alphaproteobacteria bacterium]|nr:hypothetical protein [Alphaproteobacteria bacterium]
MKDASAPDKRAGGYGFATMRLAIVYPLAEIFCIIATIPLLLAMACWNGFPIIFYDTGAYVLEGLGHVFVPERSPVYSLLLLYAKASYSLWLVALFQAAITSFLIVELARAEAPHMGAPVLLAVVLLLVLGTGVAWYAGEVEPDGLTAAAAIATYLLSFRTKFLGPVRAALTFAIAILAIAVHASHLALAIGLLLTMLVLRAAAWIQPPSKWTVPSMVPPSLAVAGAVALILASNHELTGKYFISRSGSVFAFARMLQDGLVKRVLDDTCPSAHFTLCSYRRSLPTRADAFLWDASSPFNRLDRFYGSTREYDRIVVESLRRYPLANLRASAGDTIVQFLKVRTGDQIEPQEWILYSDFAHYLPTQMDAYMSARQQQGLLRFGALNMVHVGVAFTSIVALLALLWLSLRRNRPQVMTLGGFILLALIGNAFICGVFSNPHDRYQSRIIWLPTLVCMLLGWQLRSPVLAKDSRIRHLMTDG